MSKLFPTEWRYTRCDGPQLEPAAFSRSQAARTATPLQKADMCHSLCNCNKISQALWKACGSYSHGPVVIFNFIFWKMSLNIFISLFHIFCISSHERNTKFWTISEREKIFWKTKTISHDICKKQHLSLRTRKQVFSFWKCWTVVVYLWAALFRAHRRAQDASQATQSPKYQLINFVIRCFYRQFMPLWQPYAVYDPSKFKI